MYDAVLLPPDGSEGSAAAVEVGLALTAQSGPSAPALHVVDELRVHDEYDLAVETASGATSPRA